MNRQLTELLTDYGPVRVIWFDGWWDHDSDSVPFDWQLGPQYEMIHRLQPSCMVGNNHHQDPFEGEDIQIFERDVRVRILQDIPRRESAVCHLKPARR